jgi:hypothetical protein
MEVMNGSSPAKIYDFVGREGGTVLRMRLAMKTGLSSEKAAGAPDTPELVEKCRQAAREITGKEPPQ